jgi:predicted phosphoribosyltransferase
MKTDEVVSVAEPEMFPDVSQWYEDFNQISDEDLQRLLESNAGSLTRAA